MTLGDRVGDSDQQICGLPGNGPKRDSPFRSLPRKERCEWPLGRDLAERLFSAVDPFSLDWPVVVDGSDADVLDLEVEGEGAIGIGDEAVCVADEGVAHLTLGVKGILALLGRRHRIEESKIHQPGHVGRLKVLGEVFPFWVWNGIPDSRLKLGIDFSADWVSLPDISKLCILNGMPKVPRVCAERVYEEGIVVEAE